MVMTDYNKPTEKIRRILAKECELYAPPSNFGFTGICPCGGRVTYYFTGKKPNRTSLSTCRACGRAELVQES
jgi:hypothetical protein